MNTAIIQAALALIETLLTDTKLTTPLVQQVIAWLEAVVPIVAQEAADLATPIKNIIALLSADDAATAEQVAALADLDAKVDAAFDQAVAAYDTNHPET